MTGLEADYYIKTRQSYEETQKIIDKIQGEIFYLVKKRRAILGLAKRIVVVYTNPNNSNIVKKYLSDNLFYEGVKSMSGLLIKKID